MSIVGTRPPLISETNLYEPRHKARLAIKPGITGMWQVSGRSDITDFEEVVRLDKEYIENWDASLASIFEKLSDFVHPLVLGEVYRSKAQIQMMAEQLIQNQVTDPDKIKKIIAFLCSESGSHDYTINRREAQNELGLNVKKPSPEQYELIKKLYDDINDELLFSKPFMLTEVNGAYTVRRCLLESVVGGSDYFSTEGVVVRASMPDGQIAIQNRVNFEGWRHDRSSDDDNLAITDGEETIIYERGADYQT